MVAGRLRLVRDGCATLAVGFWYRMASFAILHIPERLAWDVIQPVGVDVQVWKMTVEGLHAALQLSDAVLRSVEDLSADLLCQHASRLMANFFHVFEQPIQPGWVRWVQRGHTVKLIQAPVDISETMRSGMRLPDSAMECGQSWIFTSATLATTHRWRSLLSMCGLAQVLQVSSPFDFFQQGSSVYSQTFRSRPCMQRISLVARGSIGSGWSYPCAHHHFARNARDCSENLRQYFSEMQSMDILFQASRPMIYL